MWSNEMKNFYDPQHRLVADSPQISEKLQIVSLGAYRPRYYPGLIASQFTCLFNLILYLVVNRLSNGDYIL